MIEVVIGNVEDIAADAVVNAANEGLLAGGGICGAIFRKAGYSQLQAACDKVAPCPTGEARITPAFGISNAKFIIHAVGPRYRDGEHGEPELLANCYRNLLKTAVENGCKSVAVPSISTGIFGYPLEDAVAIATREAEAFVKGHADFKIIFVIWGGGSGGGLRTKKMYEEYLTYGMSRDQYWREMDEIYGDIEEREIDKTGFPPEYTGYGYNLRMKIAFAGTKQGFSFAVRSSKIPPKVIVNDPETVHTTSDDFSYIKKIGYVSSAEGRKIDEEEIARAKAAGLIK